MNWDFNSAPRHNSNWISLRDSSLGMVWGWEVQLWLVRSERSKSLAHSKAVQWWSLATTVASDNLLCCGAFNGYNRCVSRFFAPGHFGIESWEIHNTKHICARTTVDKKLYMVCIYIWYIIYIHLTYIYMTHNMYIYMCMTYIYMIYIYTHNMYINNYIDKSNILWFLLTGNQSDYWISVDC
jgi:hypothetical protein